jgi:serine/threonine protein kinase
VIERIADIRVLGLLGEGGSAIVYAGVDGGEEVAVKVLRAEGAVDARDVARFLSEAQHLERVRHPNLIAVRRAGTLEDGRAFIVMERLRGETLAARLERGPLSRKEALEAFAKIADAVATLHDAGLIHRDVKPENVFVREPNDEPVLLDLGIAREAGGDPGTTTSAGVVRGTRATMAPERFFGTPASVATEVYELGLLLYAMLTGGLPWGDGADANERLHARAPDVADPSIPRALSEAVLVALSTRAERRPRSVRELAANVAVAANSSERVRETAEVSVLPMPPTSDGVRPDLLGASSTDAQSRTSGPSSKPASRKLTAAFGLALAVAVGWIVWLYAGSARREATLVAPPSNTETEHGASPPLDQDDHSANTDDIAPSDWPTAKASDSGTSLLPDAGFTPTSPPPKPVSSSRAKNKKPPLTSTTNADAGSCVPFGGACDRTTHCCQGEVCYSNHLCGGATCKPGYHGCASDNECCSNRCVYSVCKPPP